MVCKDDIILQMSSVKSDTCIHSYLTATLRIKQTMNIKSNHIRLILQKETMRYQQLKQNTRNHEWVSTS